MTTSQTGRNLIRKFEGYAGVSYRDSAGVWTCGVGHTLGVDENTRCTPEEADVWLAQDLKTAEQCIQGNGNGEKGLLFDVPLSQNQFDALVSWIFNLGCGNFVKSTIYKRLKNQDYQGAAEAWIAPALIWNKAGGKVLAGLTARRNAEHDLFVTPVEGA